MRTLRIESDADLEPIFEAPPLGSDPAVLKRLRQMYEAGGWVLLESTLADIPADLRWLIESGAITIEQTAAAHRALGVTSGADVAAAIDDKMLRRVAGFGEAGRSGGGRGAAASAPQSRRIRWGAPSRLPDRCSHTCGRCRASSGPSRPDRFAADRTRSATSRSLPRWRSQPRRSMRARARRRHPSAPQRASRLHPDRARADRSAIPEPLHAGAALLYLTGSAAHFAALRAHAERLGLRLTAAGLHTGDGRVQNAEFEDDLYHALGLPTIPPEIRNGDDEVGLAARGALPALVTRRDIRGDLHMHSTWSDGRDSIEAMVIQCRALGYEYMAITDHSPTSAASRNLTIDGVTRQGDEIDALRARHPDIAILHGCEVDILPDGRLDFPDRVLERFDIVLASLHERAGHDRDQLMQRYVAAMEHPLVAMITHPTNRLVPYRAGYDLDYDRLFDVAVETGTIVEVDGAPSHLDLDGALARRAIAAGAELAIDSDCHRAEFLDVQMQLGIVTARRGWVEPRHVINTRPLADVRAAIARKRAGR